MTGRHRLARYRTTRHLTRRQLAAELGVHVSMVSQLERGERRPGLALACRIAELTSSWIEGAITPWQWLDVANDNEPPSTPATGAAS